MKIIESIKNYISELDCMSTFENVVNVNYLADDIDSFSIEEIPCNPIIKKYLDGSNLKQYQFVFCSREPYSSEEIQNIENSSFYEDFANEIEQKNNDGLLPTMNGKYEPLKIEVISSAYTVSVTEDSSMYQINLKLKYLSK